MKVSEIKVEGMTCGHCVSTVEGALRSIGIKGKADLKSNSVKVEFDEGSHTLEQIKAAVSATGYPVL